MNIEKFNNLQIKKVNDVLKNIIEQYKTLKSFINEYHDSFVDLKDLVVRLEQNSIVSKKVRQTYYILLKDFFNKYEQLLDSWDYMKHISIYIKKNVGEYVEENIITLPLFDIYREDPNYMIEVDENSFIIPVKIKTYLDNVDNFPINYYKKFNNKYMSTNKFAINVIERVLLGIDDINICLDNLIDSAFKLV